MLRARTEKEGDATSVVVSTICTVHNVFGRIYLFFIVPFHRRGVQSLMRCRGEAAVSDRILRQARIWKWLKLVLPE